MLAKVHRLVVQTIRRAIPLAIMPTIILLTISRDQGVLSAHIGPAHSHFAIQPHDTGTQVDTPEVADVRSAADEGYEWPQVQRDAQRTGHSPETLGANLEVAWTHPFQPEKVHPQVQAIVYQGSVFVGTEMGTMYSLNAQVGTEQWAYDVGAPILNSVAAGDGRVYFGAMDGAIYALDASNGTLDWRSELDWRLGFSTAPVLADNKVMIGGRNGVFYALDPQTGVTVWEHDVGSPVLQTAAWDDGRAYFGAMDMRVYAINTNDGSLSWRTDVLDGMAYKDYWPVIHDGAVVVRPMGMGELDPGFPFVFGSSEDWDWLMTHGPAIAAGNLASVADAIAAQDAVLAAYEAHPEDFELSLHILDSDTGLRAAVVPHWGIQTMNGATTPPCVDRDGLLVIPTHLARSGWGRVNLTTGRINDILYDHYDSHGGPMEPGDTPAGMGNPDENLNVTCTANAVIAMHTEEYNANYTGVFDQDERRWYRLGPGHTNREMSTNTQGGGGNPASVALGFVYHISYHELIARLSE